MPGDLENSQKISEIKYESEVWLAVVAGAARGMIAVTLPGSTEVKGPYAYAGNIGTVRVGDQVKMQRVGSVTVVEYVIRTSSAIVQAAL